MKYLDIKVAPRKSELTRAKGWLAVVACGVLLVALIAIWTYQHDFYSNTILRTFAYIGLTWVAVGFANIFNFNGEVN